MSILGPAFLVNRIPLIALITGIVVIVILAEILHRKVIFPLSDMVREKTRAEIKNKIHFKKNRLLSKYLSEGLATTIFIIYCYLGAEILTDYFFEPIIYSMRDFLILVLLGLFLGISYLLNTPKIRKIFFTLDG